MSTASADRVSSRPGGRDRQRDGDRQPRGQGGGRRAGVSRLPDRGPRRRASPTRRRPSSCSTATCRTAAQLARVRRPAPRRRGPSPSRWSTLFRQIPPAIHPMDVLRTSVSVLAHFDPEVNAPPTRPRGQRPQGRADDRPDADRRRLPRADRRRARSRSPPATTSTTPANFLHMVNGKVPSETMRQGVRPLAGPLHRARAERLDLLGAG